MKFVFTISGRFAFFLEVLPRLAKKTKKSLSEPHMAVHDFGVQVKKKKNRYLPYLDPNCELVLPRRRRKMRKLVKCMRHPLLLRAVAAPSAVLSAVAAGSVLAARFQSRHPACCASTRRTRGAGCEPSGAGWAEARR